MLYEIVGRRKWWIEEGRKKEEGMDEFLKKQLVRSESEVLLE